MKCGNQSNKSLWFPPQVILVIVLVEMNKALVFAFALLSVVLADKYAIVFQGDTGFGNYSDSSNTCRAYDVHVHDYFDD